MTDHTWEYRARILRVVDADTLYVEIDHGMQIRSVQSVRVQGYDGPELFSGTPEERLEGAAAKQWTEAWVDQHAEHEGEWPARITTTKDRRSFNRYIATVRGSDGHDLTADWLEAHP